jgi:hypothetical protein
MSFTGFAFYFHILQQTLSFMKQFWFLLMVMMALLLSCKKGSTDDQQNPGPPGVPANEIEDGNGLRITLSWVINDGSAPNTFADLDIFLYSGTGSNKILTTYGSDASNTSSEMFTFPSTLADGDYTVTVSHFTVIKPGTMSFTFQAATGTKTHNVNNIPFVVADDSIEKDMIKIVKLGNKFTVTKI